MVVGDGEQGQRRHYRGAELAELESKILCAQEALVRQEAALFSQICDRVAILREGQVIAQGEINDVVADGEELEDAFVRLVRGGA